jgi:hypothetical protein
MIESMSNDTLRTMSDTWLFLVQVKLPVHELSRYFLAMHWTSYSVPHRGIGTMGKVAVTG